MLVFEGAWKTTQSYPFESKKVMSLQIQLK